MKPPSFINSGVPAGCLAESPGASPQTADPACANGQNIKTSEERGKQVKAMYPGYTGAYPRLAAWHGTSDTFVGYKNLAQQLKEWSGLLGASLRKNITNKSHTQLMYGNGTKPLVYSAQGFGHTVPVYETEDLKWFDL